MKLNIEIQAWMCGLQEVTPGGFLVTKSDVEAFARLVLEKCAQEAEALADKLLCVHDNEGASIALEARGNIRQLLED